uniref:Transposon protein, putative, CACTA, En/Spm sub-class n=1 Tax=Oryza sativa subsp. japonica TaxID=39947 RepID=Q2QVH4_ORYSJ|nr:transposon protein, putative, CACTA, En/Spm sub-class [Oryza sativa Japonica Group]
MEEDEAEKENIPDWAQFGGFDGNTTGELDEAIEDNDVADDLGQMLRDVKDDCESCEQGHKKLGTTLEFLQWKAKKNGVSDKAFGKLLKLLKNILPEGNKLFETTYEAKKLVYSLGLEVQKIHACPNDCILYRCEEYENLEVCPVCKALRYKIKRDDPGKVDGQPSKKRVPAKVMWIKSAGTPLALEPSLGHALELSRSPRLRVFLHRHAFLARPVGLRLSLTMSTTKVSEKNIILVKVEDLSEEQRADMEQIIQQFRDTYLNSYFINPQGEVVQKGKFTLLKQEEEETNDVKVEVKMEEELHTFQDRVDSTIFGGNIPTIWNVQGQHGNWPASRKPSIGSRKNNALFSNLSKADVWGTRLEDPQSRTIGASFTDAVRRRNWNIGSSATSKPTDVGQSADGASNTNNAQPGQSQQTHQPQLPIGNVPIGPQYVNVDPNITPYQQIPGFNIGGQYQPLSPMQYWQASSPFAQVHPQPVYNQYEQQYQGGAQQQMADVIAEVVREQFGIKPKDSRDQINWYACIPEGEFSTCTGVKQISQASCFTSTPEYFDKVPLPNRYKIPGFSKFSGQDNVSTYEHISQCLAQCDFESLAHLAQKVLAHEQHFQEAKRFKKVNYVYRYASDSDDDQDTEIGLAEWSKFKKTMMCQWVKDTSKEEKYDFDINKADKIFDLLLQEKQIQLPVGHILPSAEELKKRKYCKWHNTGSHHTNECKVFRQQIQSSIEQGRIKFDDGKEPMKIDGHPFPVNVAHATVDSSRLISKYQRKHDRRVRSFRRHQDDNCHSFAVVGRDAFEKYPVCRLLV